MHKYALPMYIITDGNDTTAAVFFLEGGGRGFKEVVSHERTAALHLKYNIKSLFFEFIVLRNSFANSVFSSSSRI